MDAVGVWYIVMMGGGKYGITAGVAPEVQYADMGDEVECIWVRLCGTLLMVMWVMTTMIWVGDIPHNMMASIAYVGYDMVMTCVAGDGI